MPRATGSNSETSAIQCRLIDPDFCNDKTLQSRPEHQITLVGVATVSPEKLHVLGICSALLPMPAFLNL